MDDDELVNLARLGMDAEAFERTKLGAYMVRSAADEIAAATAELVAAAPDDVKLNTDLRVRIHAVRMFLVWMREAINTGFAAHEHLKTLED